MKQPFVAETIVTIMENATKLPENAIASKDSKAMTVNLIIKT